VRGEDKRIAELEAAFPLMKEALEEAQRDADTACNPHSGECETEEDEGCTCWIGRMRAALDAARKVTT
jgi:hypothetical protein